MTNISKNQLDPQTLKQLFKQLTIMFGSANEKQTALMFEALFTESEKIMFVKRVAIILLLAEGYSTYSISKRLKVSDSTVRDIKKQAKAGKFDPLIKTIHRGSFDKEKFWETVEILLRGGLPSRGKDRWKWLNKQSGR